MDAVELSSYARDICNEFDEPSLKDWELFVEITAKKTKIYRCYRQDCGLYEYKSFSIFDDISPEIFMATYLDIEYLKKWDLYIKDAHEVIEGNTHAMYWEVKWPFPMNNRDYVFTRHSSDTVCRGRKIYFAESHATQLDSIPEKRGAVRVTDYKQMVCASQEGTNATNVIGHYFDNPKSYLPKWLINWGAKNGVPIMLDQYYKACLQYKKNHP